MHSHASDVENTRSAVFPLTLLVSVKGMYLGTFPSTRVTRAQVPEGKS